MNYILNFMTINTAFLAIYPRRRHRVKLSPELSVPDLQVVYRISLLIEKKNQTVFIKQGTPYLTQLF